MALTTFSGLKEALADYLMRDDLIDRIPDLITLAESRIARELRVADMETTATANLTDGAVALPSDFIEARRIVGDGSYTTPLQFATPAYVGETYVSSSAGVPVHYTITGNTLTTYPNGGSSAVTMIYYAKPEPLSEGVTTNWLLTKAPELYLYGALIESAPFLGDDARLKTWGDLFKTALDGLQKADERARYGNSVSRVRGPTP